ncbi:hybrid-cluster NAD(P)-dependent oxidoreductase [Mangrovactinospora gilvigrisea]|uniref:Hybrid-cluster NAD(P)-dependent oxidoreductase n=2 Tax=Mangrovactinospora gilvigrisea TaxID=1428644 RepID=A0A1J7BIF6_9ACTN|nr:hybrid-cluster NAD(P)-dependent oxidoreductase [Mangrovactinospora gilvigrisea]
MRTFLLEPADGQRELAYSPGQYLDLAFDLDGEEVHRCYTLSSSPLRPGPLAITVRRVPGGRVSPWLHDRFGPGATVRARGPLGRFSTADHPAPAYLFLSGGAGATPMISMTRALFDAGSAADAVFVHSARGPEHIPFRRELELMAAAAPALRVHHLCEPELLTAEALADLVPDLPAREIFCCGPAGYMAAVRAMLPAGARYHQESFTVEAEPVAAGGFAVRLARSGVDFPCPPGTPLLRAAAAAGVTLPSSCGEGLCGTCVTPLVQGSVEMHHNGGLGPRDEAAGRILLCCSTPLEDLVLDA